MYETYLQNEREFDEKFPEQQKEATHYQDVEGKEDCLCFSCNDYREEIKSHNRLSLIKVMKALEEELEGEKKEIPLIWKIVREGSAAQLAKRDRENFNEGLQLSLDKIREFIKEIEE